MLEEISVDDPGGYGHLSPEYSDFNSYDTLRQEILDDSMEDSYSDPLEDKLAELETRRQLAIDAALSWDHNGIATRLDRVAASGRAVRPMPDTTVTPPMDFTLPKLGKIRKLAQGSAIRMALARDAGEWDQYVRSFEHIMALGRVEMQQSSPIDRLVGLVVRALGFSKLTADITEGRIPAETLVKIQGAMDRQSAAPPMSYAMENEKLFDLDMVQWLYSSHGRLIVSRLNKYFGYNSPSNPIVNVASVVYPRKAATEQWFDSYYKDMRSWVDLPPATRSKTNPAVDIENLSWRYPIQYVILPAIGKLNSSDDQHIQTEIGVRAIIAIARFKADTGELPDSLSDLIPTYLDTLPVDWYSENLKPLKYKILEQPDEYGRTYLLYTVGGDHTDNGGLSSGPAPWGSGGKNVGYDVILNHPDLDR